mmetsp:Transcript_35912/g.63432  ORF Transcript_35912/g.63432 Transcript_35912/m.63432 type:complete len:214 (-) Transcript_35912:15-656(-)
MRMMMSWACFSCRNYHGTRSRLPMAQFTEKVCQLTGLSCTARQGGVQRALRSHCLLVGLGHSLWVNRPSIRMAFCPAQMIRTSMCSSADKTRPFHILSSGNRRRMKSSFTSRSLVMLMLGRHISLLWTALWLGTTIFVTASGCTHLMVGSSSMSHKMMIRERTRAHCPHSRKTSKDHSGSTTGCSSMMVMVVTRSRNMIRVYFSRRRDGKSAL